MIQDVFDIVLPREHSASLFHDYRAGLRPFACQSHRL
jgi:hypothetical protein